MACKRSAVRSRLAPPITSTSQNHQDFQSRKAVGTLGASQIGTQTAYPILLPFTVSFCSLMGENPSDNQHALDDGDSSGMP